MKKPLLLALVIAAMSVPVFGQSLELIGRYAWMTTEADENIEGTSDVNPVRFEVDDTTGYGAGINFYLSDHLSTELGVSLFEPETLTTESGDISAVLQNAEITIIPITAVLQYHFSPDGAWDFYLGAGGAWVLFDDVEGNADEIDEESVRRISFEDDAGLVANVGVNLAVTDTILVNFDAKYVPLKSASTVVFGSGESQPGQDISFNPLVVSVGAILRF